MVLSSNNQGLLHWLKYRSKKNRQQQPPQQGAQHTLHSPQSLQTHDTPLSQNSQRSQNSQQSQQSQHAQHSQHSQHSQQSQHAQHSQHSQHSQQSQHAQRSQHSQQPQHLQDALRAPLSQPTTNQSQRQSPEPPQSPASSHHYSSANHDLHRQVQAFQLQHRQQQQQQQQQQQLAQHGIHQDPTHSAMSITRRQRTLQHAPHAPHSQQVLAQHTSQPRSAAAATAAAQERSGWQDLQHWQQQQLRLPDGRQHERGEQGRRSPPLPQQQPQQQRQHAGLQEPEQDLQRQRQRQRAQQLYNKQQEPEQPVGTQQQLQQLLQQQQHWHQQHAQQESRQQELQQQQQQLQESGARALLSSQSKRFTHTPLPARSVVSTTRPRSVASQVSSKRWSSAANRPPSHRPQSARGWADDTKNQDKPEFMAEEDSDEEEISITRVVPQYISPLSRLDEGTVSVDKAMRSLPLMSTASLGARLQNRNSIEAHSQRSFAADSATPSFARSNSVSLLLDDDWQYDMSSAASPVMESSMQTPHEEELAGHGLGAQQYTCHLNASFHGYSPAMPSTLNAAPLPPQLFSGLAHMNVWPPCPMGTTGIWIKQFEDEGTLGMGPCGEVRWGLMQQQHMALKTLSRPLREYLNSCPDLRLRLEHALCTAASMRHQNVTRVVGFSLGPDPTHQRMSPAGRMSPADRMSPAGRSSPGSGRTDDMFVGEELMDFSLAHYLYGRGEGKLMRLDDVIGVGMTVASALSALHSSGVGHFGVHPNNILLDSSGNISLGDVGLASLKLAWRLRNQCVPRTAAPYMAPECFSKCSGGITMQADLYSLGILLWECLIGRVPWSGLDTADIVVQAALHNRRPPLPLNALRCPPALANIITELWHPSPWCRPDTMRVYSRLADLRARLIPNLVSQPNTGMLDAHQIQHQRQQQQQQHKPPQPPRQPDPQQAPQQDVLGLSSGQLSTGQATKSGSLNYYASSWDTDSEECDGQPVDTLSQSVSSADPPAPPSFKVHRNQLVEHMMNYKMQ